MDLPIELQAYILGKLDGASLARAKKVCSIWFDATEKLEEFGNIWKCCCYREIPPEMLCQLTGCNDLAQFSPLTQDWIYWREIYAVYHRTTYIKACSSWKFTSLNFQPHLPYHAVSCLKLHKSDLVVGFRNGYVCVCKKPNEEKPEFIPLLHHGRHVTSLQFTSNSPESIPLLVSVSGGHDIQVISLDSCIQYQLNYHSKPVNCASSWSDMFVTGSGDCMLHGQPIWRVDRNVKVNRETVLTGHLSERVTCTAIWADKVASGDDKGNILIWDISHPNSPYHIGSFCSRIKWICLRGPLLLWMTVSGVLYVSTDCQTYQRLDVCKAIHGKPESLTLKGSMFAIGTKSGFVHLYHISSLREWNDLDLSNPHSTIKVEAEHVNALEIGDNGVGPQIIIATDVGVTLVNWHKFSHLKGIEELKIST